VNVGAANQANWLRMLEAIDAPQLNEDPRFNTNQNRMVNRVALIDELEQVFVHRTTDDWVKKLNNVGIPAGPLLNIPQMHQDPQALAREMITEVDHPIAGKVKTIGAPVKFPGKQSGVRCAAPLLGQHTREVLAEIRYSTEEINVLFDESVVGEQ